MEIKDITYRPAQVAGSFYPDGPQELKEMLNEYLNPDVSKKLDGEEILAIVAPHAGYVFSGQIAAMTYRELEGRDYDVVIIIGPTHVKAFVGASVFNGDAFVSPLGNAMVDTAFARELSEADPVMKLSLSGHEWQDGRGEHSIEVQVPFLQVVLPDVPIVPVCMGSQDYETADGMMKAIVKTIKNTGKKALIVASSDLSHFHPEEDAHKLDANVVEAFDDYDYFRMTVQLFSRRWEACGGGPIIVAMMAAEQLGGNRSRVIEYGTSADAPEGAGSRQRVVGYFSGAILKSPEADEDLLPDLTENDKKQILDAAKLGVYNAVTGSSKPFEGIIPEKLDKNYATFVTLTKNGSLRGCMGHLFTNNRLLDEIRETSGLACTNDYRFGAVRENELNELEYEVTVLSRMIRVTDTNDIKIGRDGLFIRYGNNSGLLLPQVASERDWDVETFLENVCIKAGLPDDAYKNPEAQLYSFRAVIIH